MQMHSKAQWTYNSGHTQLEQCPAGGWHQQCCHPSALHWGWGHRTVSTSCLQWKHLPHPSWFCHICCPCKWFLCYQKLFNADPESWATRSASPPGGAPLREQLVMEWWCSGGTFPLIRSRGRGPTAVLPHTELGSPQMSPCSLIREWGNEHVCQPSVTISKWTQLS